MTPPLILYLLDYTDLGGGETSFVAFARAAAARPEALRLVTIVRGDGPLPDALRGLGVQLEIVDYPLRLRRGPIPVLARDAVAQIGALIDRHRPDLVHANNFFGLAWGGRAARRRRLPVVWTCHGWWELNNIPKRWLARWLADRVLCVSEVVRGAADRQLGGRVPTQIEHLGIAPLSEGETAEDRCRLRADVRREMGVPPDRPLLGIVARFQPFKRHALLLDTLPQLLKRHPDLLVWFIGDTILNEPTDSAEKKRLQRRVAEAGWEECVRFLGWRNDARRLMRALDALVMPSVAPANAWGRSAGESFGMAAVEGLEAGVPVVGPDASGPAEIIDAPATGRRFRPDDAADLAKQLLAVLEPGSGFDPESGPRRVAEHFSAAAHLERTLAVYRELLAARRTRP